MSGPGFTFDTGALIALERGDYRMRTVLKLARADSVRVVVPTVVLGEWWSGKTKARELLIASVQLEPLNESLAKLAGEALAKTRKATFVDAVVMASAAQRGRRRLHFGSGRPRSPLVALPSRAADSPSYLKPGPSAASGSGSCSARSSPTGPGSR